MHNYSYSNCSRLVYLILSEKVVVTFWHLCVLRTFAVGQSLVVVEPLRLILGKEAAKSNINLVIVGFRHGDRNPIKFLPGSVDEERADGWGKEGPSKLTQIGREQAVAFGHQLSRRYEHLLAGISNISTQVQCYSSTASRTKDTMAALLPALFPAPQFPPDRLETLQSQLRIDDELLRAYTLDCPHVAAIWKRIYKGETVEGERLLTEYKELMELVANETGLDPILSDVADAADNLEALALRHLQLPNWVDHNAFNRTLFADVVMFSETPQKLCIMLPACRRLMAGKWLDYIGKILENNSENHKVFHLFSTHNEILGSLLWLFGYNRTEPIYYNGAFVLEVRSEPWPAVRFIYSQPIRGHPGQRVSQFEVLGGRCRDYFQSVSSNPPQSDSYWCPIGAFLETIKVSRVANWRDECEKTLCPVELNEEDG